MLWLGAGPATAASFKVGSFTKTIAGAPAPQSFAHGLGEVPKAVILWTVGKTNEAFGGGLRAGFGFTDAQVGFADSHSQGWSINDAVNPSNADTHSSTGADPEHILVIQSPAGPVAIADFVSWDATNVNLSWLTNDGNAYVIHFIAIGGAEVVAEVVSTGLRSNVGNYNIGMNFKPDVVFLLPTQSASAPVNTSDAAPSLGVFDRHGNQWAVAGWSDDGQATSNTLRMQVTDAAVLNFAANGTISHRAVATLWDGPPAGITLSYSTGTTCGGSDCRLFVLGIAGIEAWAGSFTKATAVGPQTITGVRRMKPRTVFLASFQDVAQAAAVDHHRMGIGASDGTTEAASAWQDADNASPTSADSIDKTSKVFVKVDNSTPAIDAEADLTGFGWERFTLDWTTNDAVPTQMLYVALGEDITNYRSIGTAGPYGSGAGTVAVTHASRIVTGTGTAWASNNRGTGDVITIPCTNPPTCTGGVHYPISGAGSDTKLFLGTPYAGSDASGLTYLIRRQHTTLQGWEDCISFGNDGGLGPGSDSCTYFDAASVSLVADDRREVGIAYRDTTFTAGVRINGTNSNSNTDADHTITLTAAPGNLHHGLPGTGVVINNGANPNPAIELWDDYVTVEWMEILGGGATPWGIEVQGISAGSGATGASRVTLRNNLIHVPGHGISLSDPDVVADVYNNILYSCATCIRVAPVDLETWTRIRILNNTMYNFTSSGFNSSVNTDAQQILLTNNLAADVNAGGPQPGFQANSFAIDGASCRNLSANESSSDPTAGITFASPCGVGFPDLDLANDVEFVNAAAFNLHILPTSTAANSGADLSSTFTFDIDGGVRQTPWDIGADDAAATTAVKLQSLGAIAGDRSVVLEWRTASELDNLGFHVYRGLSENGPWTRLTSSLIPGLGSSAVGQAYSFRDPGLVNGARYFYRLEDVDASSKTTSHGPVSAVPTAGAAADESGGKDKGADQKKNTAASSCPDWVLSAYASAVGSDAATGSLRCTRHGDPEATSLGVLSRDSRSATLELRTGGFYALHTLSGAGEPSGTVRVFVPGFDFPQDEKQAALPIRRALTDAVVGRRVQLGGVRALDIQSFKGLVPSSLGKAEMQVGWDGTVRAARRSARALGRQFPRSELVTLLPSLFQGEQKSAVVEIAPLRFDAQRSQLVLAKRVRVRLLFTGREVGESGRGSLGRAPGAQKPAPASGEILARLYTTSPGLYSASFEQLFPGQRRGLSASQLRLERQGEAVGYHLEPSADSFGPGSRLYFYADRAAASTDFTAEVAYELVRSAGGVAMPLQSAAPGSNGVTTASIVSRSFETNRFYQPGLLEAADPWLWEGLTSGATRTKSLVLSGVSGSGEAELDVSLQGGSESGQAVDHQVRLTLNGTLVGEAQFAGKKPYRVSLSLQASLLREGANDLQLTNIGDTGVSSLVFLDRFTLAHPQASSLVGGVFEGTWSESGTATVTGATGELAALDLGPAGSVSASGADSPPRWLTGHESTAGGVRFHAEAARRYSFVLSSALLSPRVATPLPSTLKSAGNQADYILIAPQAFLPAAEPLVQRRQDQGLTTHVASFEEIASEFGHGQASAEAIKAFLAYAYHSWTRPSPRYVLLLGDSNYDPRNFIGTSQPSPLPALWAKTSYLWTVSDPQLAAVNGADALPDLAIGRLPATTVEQAQALIEKLLAWEDSGQGLSGSATLVADNPDIAGDFERDVRDIAQTHLADRNPQLLLLSELGPELRPRILEAMNSGLSYLNYVGHGGAAVWASENVWNNWDATSLQAQSQQPLLVTMNCLNGYFVAPAFDSLTESLLKAERRGAVAAFSPSGLSLDGPAHQYHHALMAELTSGRHARFGDALLAAQKSYAGSGLMPELLGIYHFFGDPATRLR
jgi:hypothetical protein